MSIAKSDRFCFKGIEICLPEPKFQEIVFKNIWMYELGESNYKDLVPEELPEGVEATQRIYSDINGNLYEICLLLSEDQNPVICGAKTRQQE